MDPVKQAPSLGNPQEMGVDSVRTNNSATSASKHALQESEKASPAKKQRTFVDLTRERNQLFTINFNNWLLHQDLTSLDAAFFSGLKPQELDPSVLNPLSRMTLRRAFLLQDAGTVEQFNSFLPSLSFFQDHRDEAQAWISKQLYNLAGSPSSIKPLLQALVKLPPEYKISPVEEKKLLRAVVQQSKTDKLIPVAIPSSNDDDDKESTEVVKIPKLDHEVLLAWLALGGEKRFISFANDCIDEKSHLFCDWFLAIAASYNHTELRPLAEHLATLFHTGVLPSAPLAQFEKCIPPQLDRKGLLFSIYFLGAIRPEEDVCEANTALLTTHFKEDPDCVVPFFVYESLGESYADGDQQLNKLRFDSNYFESRTLPALACEFIKRAKNLASMRPLIHLLSYLANVTASWQPRQHDPLPWPMLIKTICDNQMSFRKLETSDAVGILWLLMYSPEPLTAQTEEAFLNIFLGNEKALVDEAVPDGLLSSPRNAHYEQLLKTYLDQRSAINEAVKKAAMRPDLPVEGVKDLKALPVAIEPLSLLIALETKAESYKILPLLTNFPKMPVALDTLKLLGQMLKNMTICDVSEITLAHLQSLAHLIDSQEWSHLLPLLALRPDLFEPFTQWMMQQQVAGHDVSAIPFWARCCKEKIVHRLPDQLRMRISGGGQFTINRQTNILLMRMLGDIHQWHDITISAPLRAQLSLMLKSIGLNKEERVSLHESVFLLDPEFRKKKVI